MSAIVASKAVRKRPLSLHLHGVNCDPETEAWFAKAPVMTRNCLDMGKSCVRFHRAVGLPPDRIGAVVARTGLKAGIAACDRTRRMRPA